jgi:hypothetical protein
MCYLRIGELEKAKEDLIQANKINGSNSQVI